MSVTPEQLADALEANAKNIKDHMNLTMAPIIKTQECHNLSLYGKEGRNGVVGDVNRFKAGVKIFGAVGGLSGIGLMIKEFFWRGH